MIPRIVKSVSSPVWLCADVRCATVGRGPKGRSQSSQGLTRLGPQPGLRVIRSAGSGAAGCDPAAPVAVRPPAEAVSGGSGVRPPTTPGPGPSRRHRPAPANRFTPGHRPSSMTLAVTALQRTRSRRGRSVFLAPTSLDQSRSDHIPSAIRAVSSLLAKHHDEHHSRVKGPRDSG